MSDELRRTPSPDPSVTLVVAMRNEAATIEACLRSLMAQSYPAARIEILVYDGASEDESRSIAERTLGGRAASAVRVNTDRTQATSWNLGIDTAKGEIIGIVSGHAVLDADYVRAAVDCLTRTGADMVGGPVHAIGDGDVGEAIALAMSTPFGVGGASFRYLDREQRVDTVFMGICRAETYRQFRFDPEMVRNQDDELSYRILDARGAIVCSPAIMSSYRSRTTLPSLWSQYYAYGYWKVRVAEKHPAQIRPRHLAPMGLVAGLAATAAGSIVWRPAAAGFVAIAGSYGAGMAVQVLRLRDRAPARVLAILPAAFAVLHLAYGTGFLVGLLERRAGAIGIFRSLAAGVLRRATR